MVDFIHPGVLAKHDVVGRFDADPLYRSHDEGDEAQVIYFRFADVGLVAQLMRVTSERLWCEAGIVLTSLGDAGELPAYWTMDLACEPSKLFNAIFIHASECALRPIEFTRVISGELLEDLRTVTSALHPSMAESLSGAVRACIGLIKIALEDHSGDDGRLVMGPYSDTVAYQVFRPGT